MNQPATEIATPNKSESPIIRNWKMFFLIN